MHTSIKAGLCTYVISANCRTLGGTYQGYLFTHIDKVKNFIQNCAAEFCDIFLECLHAPFDEKTNNLQESIHILKHTVVAKR